jgi:hypothetical protein
MKTPIAAILFIVVSSFAANADGLPTKIGRTTCLAFTASAKSFLGENKEIDEMYHDATTWLDGYVLPKAASQGSLVDKIRKTRGYIPAITITDWASDYCKRNPGKSILDAGNYMLYRE